MYSVFVLERAVIRAKWVSFFQDAGQKFPAFGQWFVTRLSSGGIPSQSAPDNVWNRLMARLYGMIQGSDLATLEECFAASPDLLAIFSKTLGVPFCYPAVTAVMATFNSCTVLLQREPSLDTVCVGALLIGVPTGTSQLYGQRIDDDDTTFTLVNDDEHAPSNDDWRTPPIRVLSGSRPQMYELATSPVWVLPVSTFFVVPVPHITHDNVLGLGDDDRLFGVRAAAAAAAAEDEMPPSHRHADLQANEAEQFEDAGMSAYMRATRATDADDQYRPSPFYDQAAAQSPPQPNIPWGEFVRDPHRLLNTVRARAQARYLYCIFFMHARIYT
jgi:hypothetical protein